MMRRWSFAGTAVVASLTAGCAMSPEMRLEPGARGCPPSGSQRVAGERAITWYGPVGADDGRDNGLWCETVGPSVVDTVPGARLPDTALLDSIAVVSWNIWIGGGDVARFLEEQLGYGCHPTSPELSDGFAPFVLLIQEAFRRSDMIPDVSASFRFPSRIVPDSPPEGWPDIVELARGCALALLYVPSQRNGSQTVDGRREDKGNAILSTLPLRELIAIELPFEAGRKVAIGATIRGPDGSELRLVNVHLDIGSTLHRTLTTANTGRLRQALGLVGALDLAEGEGDSPDPCGEVPHPIATVAAGDFNTWSASESAIDRMHLCFPGSPPWDGEPTHRSFPTDFIFFRQAEDGRIRYVDGSERRVEERYGSDHHARIAWFGVSE